VLLVAALCVVSLVSAPASAGPGRNKNPQTASSDERAGEQRGSSGGQRNNKPGRERTHQQYQNAGDRSNADSYAPRYPALSPQQAAQRARSRYGGQVIKVQPAGGGYQVRLLQDDGRVVTVPVED